MMEKRVLFATILSVIFLTAYAQLMPHSKTSAPRAAAVSQEITPPNGQIVSQHVTAQLVQQFENEEVASIESKDLILTVGASSGTIRQAALKQFRNNHGRDPLLFGNGTPITRLWLNNQPLTWKIARQTDNQLVLEATDAAGSQYELSYLLDSKNPLVGITLTEMPGPASHAPAAVTLGNTWMRGDTLSGQNNHLEMVVQQRSASGGKQKHLRLTAANGKTRNVPRGTMLLALAERHFCQIVKFNGQDASTTILPASTESITTETQISLDSVRQFTATIYLGPRDYFYLKNAGLEAAFPTGMFAQIGLILLIFLNWLAGLTHNYGVAIILFSICVTCAMAPFTLMGFRSMQKMQALKPHMDRITAKHGGDQQKASPEIMALFKEHRVSPLGGCLPMLLQLPIFFALIQAISHYVEFRGKPFLWIQDLSLPDHLFHLPFSVPILGSEFNLLPILTAVAMFFQTRLSQGGMPVNKTDPTAKMMSGPLMPILFGLMFYQVPSALVLYWMINSLTSAFWMHVAKRGTTSIQTA